MRYTTAGESHGPAVVALVEGVPAGLSIGQGSLDRDLARRQIGYGRGGRMAIERDTAEVLSGIRHGRALGSPVTILVRNRDWENWTESMSAFGSSAGERVTAPRPGHADLAGVWKTGTDDIRDILERASARETAGRVAAGAVAKGLLEACGVRVRSVVTGIGSAACEVPPSLDEGTFAAAEESDVRCHDPECSQRMRDAIDAARDDGESLGGVFVVWATGLVPGIGGYASADERLDGRLVGALVSIPAIKAAEVGDGFRMATVVGSQAHDEIIRDADGIARPTNHAGGIEGGMTNGETLVLRAAMKPIPTLMRPLASVDLATGEAVDASKERSDVCAVPAAAVVAEAEVALVLADAYTSKFGGDSIADLLASLEAYRSRIGS